MGWFWRIVSPGPILKSKRMRSIFQKKGKKEQKKCLKKAKKDKIFENLGKNLQNFKIFRKMAGDLAL